ncbi:MAG TPA: nitrilase-related carbon-nitrogen hydrolase, partial [Gemmatimonadaceae bacterium]|nr:nitrilase-related carbon-nitrogen hydrolase [Gemmatimonadaceae bacterium]
MSAPLRLAIAQFQPRKGSYPGSMARIRDLFGQVAGLTPRPSVVVFPETATSGYFVEGGVEDVAVTAGQLANDLDAAWRAAGSGSIDVIIGFYERWEHTLHNSAAYVRLGETKGGEIVHVHRKMFLPTYGLFDEHRFVEPGLDVRAFDAPWGRLAVLICEDAWHSLTGTIAALDGAQMVFVISAAPARGLQPGDNAAGAHVPGTIARWERLIRDIAEEHGVFGILCGLVGSEGGKAFQGGSLVVGPHGDVRARAPVMSEALLVADIDLSDLGRARADAPMLADLRAQLPNLERELARTRANTRGSPPRFDTAERPVPQHAKSNGSGDGTTGIPVVTVPPASPPSLAIDGTLTEDWLVRFIRDEFSRRGFADAVVGLSGGVDSAVAAALAVRALGAAHVHAIGMPYRTSSAESLAHAREVATSLGIDLRVLDISAA